jgi:phage FluMu protein Com
MFDMKEKETILPVYDDGSIRGVCPDCKKAQLTYASDHSTSVTCRSCKYYNSWVGFSETLNIPKLVWVFDGKQQYLKEMNKDSLFIDGTCTFDDGVRGTWQPI